jgi:hypothetical protein
MLLDQIRLDHYRHLIWTTQNTWLDYQTHMTTKNICWATKYVLVGPEVHLVKHQTQRSYLSRDNHLVVEALLVGWMH